MHVIWGVLAVVSLASALPAGGIGATPPDAGANTVLSATRAANTRVDTKDNVSSVAWPLTRAQAILLALEHCDTIRVVSTPRAPNSLKHPYKSLFGTQIARAIADSSIVRFQGEVMALVRSVSQKFGALSLKQVQLDAVERAFRKLDAILQDDASTGCSGSTIAHDRAVIEGTKDGLRSDRAKYASELLKAEGELHSLLGRPGDEPRRIVAVDEPCDAHVEFDPNTCLREMRAMRPSIVEQEFRSRIAVLLLIIARNQLVPPKQSPPWTHDSSTCGRNAASPISTGSLTMSTLLDAWSRCSRLNGGYLPQRPAGSAISPRPRSGS